MIRFAAYDRQLAPRRDDQLNSINWLMLMAQRPLGERAVSMLGGSSASSP